MAWTGGHPFGGVRFFLETPIFRPPQETRAFQASRSCALPMPQKAPSLPQRAFVRVFSAEIFGGIGNNVYLCQRI